MNHFTSNQRRAFGGAEAVTSATVLATDYPDLAVFVDSILYEGLSLLVAAPKIGKSWMALMLGDALAAGTPAFGVIPVVARPVLYLALEDGEARLKSRLGALGSSAGHADFWLITESPDDLVGTISEFFSAYEDRQPLVVIDTLGMVRGVSDGRDVYGRDYSQLSALRNLAKLTPGAGILVVHHTSKAAKVDYVDSVSGTNGIAGAADSVLVLTRKRNDDSAVLHVTSRNAPEGEYGLKFDQGRWLLDGADLIESARAADRRALQGGVGDTMMQVIEFVEAHPGVGVGDVADSLALERGTAATYLARAVKSGRLSRPKRGVYEPLIGGDDIVC